MISLKYCTALVFVIVLMFIIQPIAYSEDLDAEVVNILNDLDYLYSRGVDIEDLVQKLDHVVKLIEGRDYDEARVLLSEIRTEVDLLKARAEEIYLYKSIYKYGLQGLVLSTPILVYILLPRIYLYLWFRFRRKWIVKKIGSGAKK